MSPREFAGFRQRDELLAGAFSARAATRDIEIGRSAFGSSSRPSCGLPAPGETRERGKLRLDKRVHLRFFQIQRLLRCHEIAGARARSARGGGAKACCSMSGIRDIVDGDIHFCHRFERGNAVGSR